MQNLVRKWRGNGANQRQFFLRHCHGAIIFYGATATWATFSVHASGAVALKVAQVPSTGKNMIPQFFYHLYPPCPVRCHIKNRILEDSIHITKKIFNFKLNQYILISRRLNQTIFFFFFVAVGLFVPLGMIIHYSWCGRCIRNPHPAV